MKKKALVLINPISGVGKQKLVERLLDENLNTKKLKADVEYTRYPGHAHTLAKNAIGNYDVVVAVGGDGTVNETGSALIGSATALAVIPTGSGNGLARHLKIPMKPEKAIRVLNDLHVKKIDTIKINDRYSLNVAGIGFDAHVSHLFAKMKQRGLISYVKLVVKEFGGYEASEYALIVDGQKMKIKAFMISFANSSQYGNNFYIAPDARVDDGLVDVCIVNNFPKIVAPALLMSMMSKENISRYLEKIIKAKEIVVEQPVGLQGHVDGEPVFFEDKIRISVNPLSLKIVVPGV